MSVSGMDPSIIDDLSPVARMSRAQHKSFALQAVKSLAVTKDKGMRLIASVYV
jgi:hypothetical protein